MLTLQFVTAIALVHGLGLQNFGIWTYLIAIGSLLGALTPGIAMSATQLISGQQDLVVRSAAINLIIIGGMVPVIFFTMFGGSIFYFVLACYPPMALKAVSGDLTVAAVIAATINGVFIQWDLICSSTLRAKLEYKVSSLIDIIGRVISVLLLSALVINEWELISLLYVNAFLVLGRATVKASAAMKGELRPDPKAIRRLLGPVTRYALYQWVQNFSAIFYASADRITVGLFLPPSMVAVAALAGQIAQQIHSIPRAFLSPLAPALITYKKNRQTLEFEVALHEARRRLILILLIIALPSAAVGPLIIWLVLNFQMPLSDIFQILLSYLFGYAIMSLSIVSYYRLIGEGRLGLSGVLNACAALLNLAAAVCLGSLFGVSGVGLSKAAYAVPYLLFERRGPSL